MTAVVLAGGRGRRLSTGDHSRLATPQQRRAAASGLKVLMPVGPHGRPLLDYALSRLADAGCSDIVLVVPPEADLLRGHVARLDSCRVRVRVAVQMEATGTAGAVHAASGSVETDECLVVNGDNLYPVEALRLLAMHQGAALGAFTRSSLERDSGFPAERVAAFAVVDQDRDGWLTGMQEKPPVDDLARRGPDALVSVNLWRLNRAILDACADVPLSSRGERELPAAVMLAVARGTRVHVAPCSGVVLDLTSAADVAGLAGALAHEEPRP